MLSPTVDTVQALGVFDWRLSVCVSKVSPHGCFSRIPLAVKGCPHFKLFPLTTSRDNGGDFYVSPLTRMLPLACSLPI